MVLFRGLATLWQLRYGWLKKKLLIVVNQWRSAKHGASEIEAIFAPPPPEWSFTLNLWRDKVNERRWKYGEIVFYFLHDHYLLRKSIYFRGESFILNNFVSGRLLFIPETLLLYYLSPRGLILESNTLMNVQVKLALCGQVLTIAVTMEIAIQPLFFMNSSNSRSTYIILTSVELIT